MNKMIEIVVLTKSWKRKNDGATYGYCVAGITTQERSFIRLVTSESGDSLSRIECIMDNNTELVPLNVISISAVKRCPLKNQIENVIVDTKNIKYLRDTSVAYIKNCYEKNDFTRTDFFGNNLSYVDIPPDYSLSCIKVTNLVIKNDTTATSKKHTADFIFDSKEINGISMTDPEYSIKREYKMENALLIISLPHEGPYNKFIAKVFKI